MTAVIAARQRLARWFPLNGYPDAIIRNRAFATYVIAALYLVFAPVFYGTVIVTLLAEHSDAAELVGAVAGTGIVFSLALISVFLTRIRRQLAGAVSILIATAIALILGVYLSGSRADGLTIYIILTMWMMLSITALLIGTRAILPVSLLIMLGVFELALKIESDSGLRLVFFIILLIALIEQIGLVSLQARAQNEAVQRISLDSAQRLTTYEAMYSLAQRVLRRPDLDTLLSDIVRLVRDSSVTIDTVQLWLVQDDRRNVTLTASTERADSLGQQVGIGSLDIVGRVTLDGKTIVVQNIPTEQSYRRSALSPGIQSQIAIPMKVVSEVIGVLLINSRQTEAFSGMDGQSLQRLADQAAIAIENSRLFTTAQSSQADNKRLAEDLRTAQKSIEQLNRQLTGQAWDDYLRNRERMLAYTIDLQSGQVDDFAAWTTSLDTARSSNQVTVQPLSGQADMVLALPISVRGQAIGALEFEFDPGRVPSAEQIAVMQQVVERMGLSAENARLFDEAQRLARREAMLSTIGARLQSAASIDSVLMAAAQSLSESLNASRVAIRLTSQNEDGDLDISSDLSPKQEAAR